ncbi:MAG: dihydroxyacetone kinase subunit L [Acidobacteria bacterium]|nr:MAG: dihydroxyacetone kinase subunit L [Acidobacteriota bacterium]
MDTFKLEQARSWILTAAAALEKNSALLCDLDAAIGDGDHGANMARGFSAVVKKMETNPPADIGALFKSVGMTLLSTVGGAAGPLYGGFFLELGKQTVGKQELDAAMLVSILEAGLADIKRRGKAELGDKTIVDALTPAIETMKGAGSDVAAATRAAAETARDAAVKTIPLLARKGRASYLGERSIGHQDPGATSTALLMESLAEVSAKA